MKWINSHIEIDPPKHPKKCTGTRFGSVLGVNPWSTPFEAWCAITRTYEKPFEDTIYTIAGKTIEPKQAEYMHQSYGMKLITPTDRYGEGYFNKTRGDFFPESPIFGGMWDYLGINEKTGSIDTVLEMKTTKRSEDWLNDIPEYYALQGALYAYLLGVDNVIMVCSFLESSDYEHPEAFKPTVKNTIAIEFKISERYPDFWIKIKKVEKWWKTHVEEGISPDYDETRDVEILNVLRTNTLSPDTDIDVLIKEAENLKSEVDKITAAISEKERRLKTINDIIKEHAMGKFRPGDKKVELTGDIYTWSISRSEVATIDKELLKADGLLAKYQKTATRYSMTVK